MNMNWYFLDELLFIEPRYKDEVDPPHIFKNRLLSLAEVDTVF